LPRSFARAITTGMQTSRQVTSTPSIMSSALPVGISLPVAPPTASAKFSTMGAAVPGTPAIAVSPS
jgi:hypothetical protein